MLSRITHLLWGKFESRQEVTKFGLLSLIFFLIIGTYWSLRPMKDSIFNALIGIDFQPLAKIFSLFVMIPLVLFYSKLIDRFSRNKVFYLLTVIYGLLGLIFMFFFFHPYFGLPNQVKSTGRILGWLWYVYVESFGSILVGMFWVFVTDITKPEAAKRGFPMIALLGQTGNILGPLLLNTSVLGFSSSAPIVGICALLIFSITAALWIFMRFTPQHELVGYDKSDEKVEKLVKKPKQQAGFLDGIKLLLTKSYLLGIFAMVAIYEIIVTILDYHFKSSAAAAYPVEAHYQAYLCHYGFLTGIVSTLCVLFGINTIHRKLGMKISLLLLPVLVAAAVILLKFNPGILSISLWIMVFSKGVNYSLNQPTIKQLYIPTTKETKYKAQAWIDMFGSRASKGLGSVVNTFKAVFKANLGLTTGVSVFLTLTCGISVGLIGVWFIIAMFIARRYNKTIDDKQVVC